jgi:hypothetical protein
MTPESGSQSKAPVQRQALCARKRLPLCASLASIFPGIDQRTSMNLRGNGSTTLSLSATMPAKPARCSSERRKNCIRILTIRRASTAPRKSGCQSSVACATNCAGICVSSPDNRQNRPFCRGSVSSANLALRLRGSMAAAREGKQDPRALRERSSSHSPFWFRLIRGR